MVHDQADILRDLVRQSRAATAGASALPLVLMHGGQGGIGTTTLATNLAMALARQGRRTMFVDADLEHGGVGAWNQHPSGQSILDVLAGRLPVVEALHRGPAGILVLSGAWASTETLQPSTVVATRFLTDLRSAHTADLAIIDAGNGRGPFAKHLWNHAHVVVEVSTSEAHAIMETYAAIKVMHATDAEVNVLTLVNRANDSAAAEVHTRLAAACQKFLGLAVEPAGHIAECPKLVKQDGLAVIPAQHPASLVLDRLAHRLWSQLQTKHEAAAA